MIGQAQARESPPTKNDVLTTDLRRRHGAMFYTRNILHFIRVGLFGYFVHISHTCSSPELNPLFVSVTAVQTSTKSRYDDTSQHVDPLRMCE